MTALHVYCPGSSVRLQRMSIMFACLATWMLAAERADPDERRFAEGNHGV
jgi:hypothetical protein